MDLNSILNNLLSSQEISLSPLVVLFSSVISLALAIIPVKIYQYNRPGGQFTDAFLIGMLLFSILSCGITLIIGSNFARAFGLIGVLSIIRFRTALKSPIDAIFAFWILTIGIGCGSGNYLAALIINIIAALLYVLAPRIISFGPKVCEGTLKILINDYRDGNLNSVEDKLKKIVRKTIALNKIEGENNSTTLVFYITWTNQTSVEEIIKELNDLNPDWKVKIFQTPRAQAYAY